MSIWNAVILGFVQGVSEFFPISSSGHISIINNLFKMSDIKSGHMLFDALLQLATLISICIVFWHDITNMLYETLALLNLGPLADYPRPRYPAARLALMIVCATLPLLLIVPIKGLVDALFYRNYFIGVTLVLTGCILYVYDKMTEGKKTDRTMTVLDALIIGLCQCVAIIPGISRTATTATAGVATGLKRDFAVKFSLLMSLPAVFGADVLAFSNAFQNDIDWSCVPAYLIGTVIAIIVGVVSIYLLRFINSRGKLGGFSYYCWVMGVLSIILTMIF